MPPLALLSSPALSPALQSRSGRLYSTRPIICSSPVASLAARPAAMASSMLLRLAMLDTQKKVPISWMERTLAALASSPASVKRVYASSILAAQLGSGSGVLPAHGLASWRRPRRCRSRMAKGDAVATDARDAAARRSE
jgi:hypothetical protein